MNNHWRFEKAVTFGDIIHVLILLVGFGVLYLRVYSIEKGAAAMDKMTDGIARNQTILTTTQERIATILEETKRNK